VTEDDVAKELFAIMVTFGKYRNMQKRPKVKPRN
jgi:hypothetical protein